MTGAALFRTLHSQGGVLLLDEAERLRNTQDPATAEILSMLLAGYKRGGTATRLEPVGDTGFKTVSFDVYRPQGPGMYRGLAPGAGQPSYPGDDVSLSSRFGEATAANRRGSGRAGNGCATISTRWPLNTARRGWNCRAEPTYARR